jgi:hypothetical protein
LGIEGKSTKRTRRGHEEKRRKEKRRKEKRRKEKRRRIRLRVKSR